jgi:hypothetical protein
MVVTQIKEWYDNLFKDGHTSVDSEPCSGRPSTSQNDQVIVKVNDVGPSCDHPRNCGRCGHQHFFGTFHSDRRFGPNDNASAHSSHLIQTSLPKKNRLPYSPDKVPCNFWLFPKLQRPLKGKQFHTGEDIMTPTEDSTRTLNTTSLKCCLPSTDRREKIHTCI